MALDLQDAPYLDILDAGLSADVRAHVSRLCATSPVLRTDFGAFVVGREAAHEALGDKRLRSGIPEVVAAQGVDGSSVIAGINNSVLAAEGEKHLRLRRLTAPALTPRAIARQQGAITHIVGELIAAIDPTGCEFMSSFADHLPIRVITHILGVPAEDQDDFAAWNGGITWVLSSEIASHASEIEWGLSNLSAYVDRLIRDRRAQPRDDLVTALVNAREHDERLSDEEIRGMIMALLFAGHDTTRNQLGLGMWLFAQHPEQWRLLREDRSLLEPAVEEVLRMRGTVSAVPRVADEDVEIAGWRLPAGTFVIVSLDNANVDPAAYRDPLVFDITQQRDLINSFGGGRHYCLGANLARAELREAFGRLSSAFAYVELAGEPAWRPPMGVFGPESMPLRFA